MPERITVFCFAASYAVALALELLQLRRPRPIQRVLSLAFGSAGLLAHTIYVARPLPLAAPRSSLLLLAWILAVFYLYGSFHHRRLAWGLFVLPLVLGLIGLAELSAGQAAPADTSPSLWPPSWGVIHGTLLLLAAAGLCVGFIASLMYLVQVQRLRVKMAPTQGVRLLNLERLEEMNRRAILWAFPLLTAGLLLALFHDGELPPDVTGPKALFTIGLWLVFAILLYLRYRANVRGRQVALLTVLAFCLMLVAFVSVHPFVRGGGP
jgi:ABC-type uncharacterized transport system permease subunit